jgi:cysteinyl-tRNA synthetase
MDDDFNTPAAMAQFQLLRGEINRLLEAGLSRKCCEQAREHFRSFGQVLGLFQLSWREWEFHDLRPPLDWIQEAPQIPVQAPQWHPAQGGPITEPIMLTDEEIERKLTERSDARRRKDFARADEIRNELAALGITIEDRPDGTSRWKR